MSGQPHPSFSSWSRDAISPVSMVTTVDFDSFVTEASYLLMQIGGYPEDYMGDIKPEKFSSVRLSNYSTKNLASFVADLSGLLFYRGIPLVRRSGMAHGQSLKQETGDKNLEELEIQLAECKEELIDRHRKVSTLQDEVSALKDSIISMKDSLLERSVSAVQSVVQTEMKSYSSALQTAATTVKQTCAAALAPSKLRTAIASASEDRSCNLMVYGLTEGEESGDRDQVRRVMECLEEAPVLNKLERIGKKTEERIRPVRIVFRTRDLARQVLSKAARLRDSETFRSVYIAPDRTLEERVERRELVDKLRERREQEPGRVWRIRRGTLVELGERGTATSVTE